MAYYWAAKRKIVTIRIAVLGVAVSAALCLGFYLATLFSSPPTATVHPSDVSSLQALVASYSSYSSSYASWQATQATYMEMSGLSLVAALAFALTFGILVAPKLAFLASLSFLHLHFAWTSHLFSDISASFDKWLGGLIGAQATFFWNATDLGHFIHKVAVSPVNVVVDFEALAMLTVLFVSTVLISLREGYRRAVLRGLQIAGLSLFILGAEIALFDPKQLGVHVTQTQVFVEFAPWFNNADLLLVAATILAASTLLRALPRPSR